MFLSRPVRLALLALLGGLMPGCSLGGSGFGASKGVSAARPTVVLSWRAKGKQRFNRAGVPNPTATLTGGGAHFFRVRGGQTEACWKDPGYAPVCGAVAQKRMMDKGNRERGASFYIPITSKPAEARYRDCNFMLRADVWGAVFMEGHVIDDYTALYQCLSAPPTMPGRFSPRRR